MQIWWIYTTPPVSSVLVQLLLGRPTSQCSGGATVRVKADVTVCQATYCQTRLDRRRIIVDLTDAGCSAVLCDWSATAAVGDVDDDFDDAGDGELMWTKRSEIARRTSSLSDCCNSSPVAAVELTDYRTLTYDSIISHCKVRYSRVIQSARLNSWEAALELDTELTGVEF